VHHPGTGWPNYTPGHWVPFTSSIVSDNTQGYGGSILTQVRVKVILRPAVTQPACVGIGSPSGTHNQFFFFFLGNDVKTFAGFFVWVVLSDETMILQFTHRTATGSCQHCHSWVHIPRNLGPYISVSFGTGFPFCHLLRLAGLQYKHSNMPSQGEVRVMSSAGLRPGIDCADNVQQQV
jgi:hypothetical protein